MCGISDSTKRSGHRSAKMQLKNQMRRIKLQRIAGELVRVKADSETAC